MKCVTFILFVFFSNATWGQVNQVIRGEQQSEISVRSHSLKTTFATNGLFHQVALEQENVLQRDKRENTDDLPQTSTIISPPLLTTSPNALEICAGSRTQLTANSNNTIFWYTTPPPIGSPVGTGTSYITPELNAGYYTYYAIAEHDGIKSDITAMEVVMVYPNPTLTIVSNIDMLCANETATLSVSGTTYYEWENGFVSSKITVSPAFTQEFRVTGINTAGCSSRAVYTQSVVPCHDANDDEFANKSFADVEGAQSKERLLSIYPNPNNGDFKIALNVISGDTKVEIYNSFGTLVYNSRITQTLSEINLKDYAGGIYIVRVIENDKVRNQEKLIKE